MWGKGWLRCLNRDGQGLGMAGFIGLEHVFRGPNGMMASALAIRDN